jgi:hypothetical protein
VKLWSLAFPSSTPVTAPAAEDIPELPDLEEAPAGENVSPPTA